MSLSLKKGNLDPKKQLRKAQEENKHDIVRRLCDAVNIPRPVFEFMFHPKRKWRFDICWPEHKIVVEVEGGVYNNGAHNRTKGFLKDVQKYNEAVMFGWKLLRCTNYNDPKIIRKVKELMESSGSLPVHDIRNKLGPITSLISVFESPESVYISPYIKAAKSSINYLAKRQVYKDLEL